MLTCVVYYSPSLICARPFGQSVVKSLLAGHNYTGTNSYITTILTSPFMPYIVHISTLASALELRAWAN